MRCLQVETLLGALAERSENEKQLKQKLAAKQSKIASAMRRPVSRRIPVELNVPVRRSSRLQAKPEREKPNYTGNGQQFSDDDEEEAEGAEEGGNEEEEASEFN